MVQGHKSEDKDHHVLTYIYMKDLSLCIVHFDERINLPPKGVFFNRLICYENFERITRLFRWPTAPKASFLILLTLVFLLEPHSI